MTMSIANKILDNYKGLTLNDKKRIREMNPNLRSKPFFKTNEDNEEEPILFI